ncbi:hypothetical protein Pst134EB_033426 [Puccinia striiformis f. sp. tritici]|uniref:Reverse transcriptase Ty1/copia-type domain-containing protein n=1 Tax=Puccinia striiformis f. sp. tritici PST-78 TaxID=1165861 RepID=A0A0L0V067_9BASI|nr:hypothetical protein Pst134EB_033426 [Puccinia striiformis f. sp. tritici]KNE92677.1 hypothetical protein PSTG_13889 [Puccinia striiformis f. sp. tritici PST-78]
MSNEHEEENQPTNLNKDPPTHLNVDLNPNLMSTSTSRVSITRLPILKAPGPNTNYLDWQMVVSQVFKTAKIKYVLTNTDVKLRPATWEDDNNLACSVIMQIVDPDSNLRYLRGLENASDMWDALHRAHQDCSTGGRIYWIRKLVIARIEGNDMNAHIDTLAKFHERLNSLVTPEKPLTPDDVHNAALLSSIPPDWIHCVSGLMNQEGVKTETIVQALKNESVRRESQGDIVSVSSTNTKPNVSNKSKPPRDNPSKKPRHCPLCNSDFHDLNSCKNTRQLITDHKANQKARRETAPQDTANPNTSKPPARAGRTSAATLGQSSYNYSKDAESDYSGSEIEVTAGNAVASLSSTYGPTVSLSSTEAEYKALSDSCKEGLWLRHLLTELRLRPDSAIPVHVDNEGAEALAKNPEHHARTKHIHARYHFIRECIQEGDISLLHVSTSEMLADMLTKPLPRVMLERHRLMFGIVP